MLISNNYVTMPTYVINFAETSLELRRPSHITTGSIRDQLTQGDVCSTLLLLTRPAHGIESGHFVLKAEYKKMDGFQTWKNGAGGCDVHGIHAGLSQLCRLLVEAGELVFLCVTVSS